MVFFYFSIHSLFYQPPKNPPQNPPKKIYTKTAPSFSVPRTGLPIDPNLYPILFVEDARQYRSKSRLCTGRIRSKTNFQYYSSRIHLPQGNNTSCGTIRSPKKVRERS